MNVPKPSGCAFSTQGADNAGDWHNWGLNDYFEQANAGGNVKWAPEELSRLVDEMFRQSLINDIEKGYLLQYAGRIGQHYNAATRHWDRGTAYIAGLVSDIAGIHIIAASDANAVGGIFKTVSNIAMASATYWQGDGASVYDPNKLSMSALLIGDIGGAVIGAIYGVAAGAGIGDVIGAAIVGAMVGSIFGPIVGALKGT